MNKCITIMTIKRINEAMTTTSHQVVTHQRIKTVHIVIATIALQVLYVIYNNVRNTNNVCKTFEDYYTDRDSNENCYYNPDYQLTAPEIIQRHGYPLEIYYVTTDDGHVLTLYRIPHGRNGNSTTRRSIGKPVLLQHGFISNCAGFVNIGQKSLAFILANEGYDVWLGNFRGTKYSTNHTHLTTSDGGYWNFTFHEYGVYDLPAFIDFISNTTNQKITYIGFSLGTSAMYIYSTTYPETAEARIDLAVSLGPAAFTGDMQSVLQYGLKLWRIIKVLEMFDYKLEFPETLAKYVCGPYPFQMKLCYFPINLACGFNYKQLDPENLLSSVNHLVDTLHLKTWLHVSQMSLTNKFRQFNYGSEGNLEIYGSTEPPIYNLSKITVPMYLIRADNDLLVEKNGVEKLHRLLPKSINKHEIYVINDADFSHMDFLNGKDVVPLLYTHLLDVIGEYSRIDNLR